MCIEERMMLGEDIISSNKKFFYRQRSNLLKATNKGAHKSIQGAYKDTKSAYEVERDKKQ